MPKGYAYSVIGGRQTNEDAFLICDPLNLYAVADGVGGGIKGGVASSMAVKGLKKYIESGQSLGSSIQTIQQDILFEAINTLGEPLMGTTLTAIRLENNQLNIAHVGDSRCYLYTEKLLRQLTEDQEIYDDKLKGMVLCSYLGISSEEHPLKIAQEVIPVSPNDRLILCSDGLYRQVEETRVSELIRQYGATPEALVMRLCEEAAQKEHSDNVTVVYIEV
jgi:protein phosphatase